MSATQFPSLARVPGLHDRKALIVHACGATIGLALATALYVVVVQPSQNATRKQSQQRVLLTELSHKQAQLGEATRAKRAEALEIEKQLVHQVQLQDPSRVNRAITDIIKLGEGHRVSVNSAKSGEYQPVHADYGRIAIELGGTGQPADVLSFLGALREASRDMEVVKATLDASASRGEAPATYTIALHWHTLPTHRVSPRAGGEDRDARSDRADRAGRGDRANRGDGAEGQASEPTDR